MASYEPYLGSIDFTGFPYATRGWALAQGQLMPISQNSALFSLLFTYYGGDGKSTFALPNLMGRVPVGQGQGNGLTPRRVGEVYGQEAVTLNVSQLPAHNHPVQLGGGGAMTSSAPAVQGMSSALGSTSAVTGAAGSNQPVPTTPPSIVLTPQVALNGLYPSRD